jgi:hypothetical protein
MAKEIPFVKIVVEKGITVIEKKTKGVRVELQNKDTEEHIFFTPAREENNCEDKECGNE